ncbi:unnamed protein product [Rangifer tarandus platyrhynchus]|uniref:Uncharacterized protein n=1 Tax=Rangifer tarandus platyrhynchus TaxID=3082113 RepID=A0ABN9A9L0_RANTA|nr:unnamed protein product [Rangifer tarandus platyrhynchus]
MLKGWTTDTRFNGKDQDLGKNDSAKGTLLSSSPARAVPSHPASQLSPSQLPNEGSPLLLQPPARATPARDPARARPSQVAHAAISAATPSSRPFPPTGAPPHTRGGVRYPSAPRTRRERSLPWKARGGREARGGVQEINRGRESPPHP